MDAARGAFSCAVTDADAVLAVETVDGKSALERGMAAIKSALDASEGVDRIAVGIGPGSFTGVRIAISYAKSLALAWRLPLAGIDTFDALEIGVCDSARPLLAVVRGRTGVVSVRYTAAGAPDRWRASGYVRDVADALSRHTEPGGTLHVIGDAEDVLGGLAERGWTVDRLSEHFSPSALAIAIAAQRREPAHSPHAVRADYGELPPAKVPSL